MIVPLEELVQQMYQPSPHFINGLEHASLMDWDVLGMGWMVELIKGLRENKN